MRLRFQGLKSKFKDFWVCSTGFYSLFHVFSCLFSDSILISSILVVYQVNMK